MKKSSCNFNCQSNAFYGLGFLGALVYFVQQSQGVVGFLFALIKAIVWPALLAYELLKFLQI